MRVSARVDAAVAAWVGTLLAAVAAAVFGVAYAIGLFLTVDWSGMSRRSESSALSGVVVIGCVGGALALWLAKRFCAASTRAADRLAGPVVGAILAFAVAVQISWGSDLGVYLWVGLVVAPLLGAFAGTAVPVANVWGVVFTATIAGAAAGYVTHDINTREAPSSPAPPRLEGDMAAPKTRWLESNARLLDAAGSHVRVMAGSSLVALGANGGALWRTAIVDGQHVRTGIVTPAGVTYLAVSGRLIEVNAEGRAQWSLEGLPAEHALTMALNDDGRLYVALGGSTGILVAFDTKARTLAWQFQFGARGASVYAPSLALSPSGGVWLTTAQGDVVALANDGREQWRRRVYGASLLSGADGLTYIMSSAGVEAVDAGGTQQWRTDGWYHRAAASPEAIVFESGNGLVSVSASGGARWTWKPEFGRTITSTPLLMGNGDVAVGIDDGSVAAIGAQGQLRWRTTSQPSWIIERLATTSSGTLAQVGGQLLLLDTR